MVKKISLEITPVQALESLYEFEQKLGTGTPAPPSWAGPLASVTDLVNATNERLCEVDEALDALRRKRGIHCKKSRLQGLPLLAEAGLSQVSIEIDLFELFDGRDAGELARALYRLLGAIARADGLQVQGKVGRDRVTGIEAATDALVEAATGFDIFLDPARQPDVRFDDDVESAPPRGRAGARATAAQAREAAAQTRASTAQTRAAEVQARAAEATRAAEAARAAEARAARAEARARAEAAARARAEAEARAAEAREAAARAKGKAGAKGGAGEGKRRGKVKAGATGSFGGLPDDALPGVGGGPKVGAVLGDEEQFFLSYTRLDWPCGVVEIRAAYRQVIKTAHPDKHPNDQGAHHRFILLKRGYEVLLGRLEVGGG